jgi:3'-5' exoribonuclease
MAGATYVTDLAEGAIVDATFAVARKATRHTRAGDLFLALELTDRTGRVPAVVWNDVHVLSGRFERGDTVRVLGRVERYGGRLQIAVRDLERAEGGDPLDLLPGARRDTETLDGFFEFLAGEIADPALRALVGRFTGDARFRERLRRAPASEGAHHAYAGGLLEHTVAVASLVREAGAAHPRLDADLVLAAALVHDAGRAETFAPGVTIELTDEGRMLGHVLAGVRMIEAAAATTELPRTRLLALLHAVASHHGPLEGRRFETAEAVCLHAANALDARVGEALAGPQAGR